MKRCFIILFSFFLLGCQQDPASESVMAETESDSLVKFFPVTEYLLGQIEILKTTPINPLKITTRGNTIDSVWLKRDQLDAELEPFLTPKIDSTNMMPYYDQSRFFDQTLNRVTLSYALNAEPETDFPLKRWDVYVNPKDGEVTLLYIVKQLDPQNTVQLSWQAGRYCQLLYIKQVLPDSSVIDKKTIIQWDFEEE